MKRLTYLDGLRGIASLGVAWFHLFTQNGGTEASGAVPHFFAIMSVWGRFGINLFFALSGFVLAYTLLVDRKIISLRDVGAYFMKRSARLDPVYWTALVVYLGLALILGNFYVGNDNRPAINFPRSIGDFVGNAFYFFPFIGHSRLIPVVWTLVLEVQLYIFFSICLYLGHKLGFLLRVETDRTTLLVLLAASLLGSLWPLGIIPSMDSWLWPYLNNFMLGVAACALVCGLTGRYLLLLCTVLPHVMGVVMTRDSYLAAGLVSFLVLVIPNWIPQLTFLLASRPLQAMGKWSYSTYLLHPIIGALAVEALKYQIGGPPLVHVMYVVLGLLATYVSSAVIWRYVEQPSIRFSKRFKISSERSSLGVRQVAQDGAPGRYQPLQVSPEVVTGSQNARGPDQ